MMAGQYCRFVVSHRQLGGIIGLATDFFNCKDSNRQTYQRTRLPFWTGLLLGLLAINEWLITPVIEAIKTNQTNLVT